MTPPSGISVAEACRFILAQPAPVFLPDTCTLLDVVRAPIRNSSYLIPLAEQFAALAAASPKRLHVVVSDTVTVEWAEHLARTVAEVESELQALRERLRAIREACTAFQLAPPAALPGDLANLPARLQLAASRLYDSALVLAVAPECLSRAYTR